VITDADRYDRQRRIKGWNQTALLGARVLVAGAGALGNELIKNLVLLGVGHLLVVDFDRIERSNLSRTVLFRDRDVGRAKAQVAVEAAASLNPDVALHALDGDLFYDVGLGFYRHCDLVVGGLDSLAARAQVGTSCALAGVPFLDGGMWALGGEVRWFMPGDGPCFECTLSDEDRDRAHERRSCTGFRDVDAEPGERRVPTTVSTAAVIGGLLAQETARYLCGWEVHAGQAAVYNGVAWTMHLTTLSRDLGCPYHEPYRDVIELQAGAADLTGAALLSQAREDLGDAAILELGRDFLLGFRCPSCDRSEAVNVPLGRVAADRARCPYCGATRAARIVAHLDGSEPYAGRPLAALGVPPGEVLAVRAGGGVALYELTADVRGVWVGGMDDGRQTMDDSGCVRGIG
jgi:adenylyltransferase/sulfurtransferase